MDERLGYPTEHRSERIVVAVTGHSSNATGGWAAISARSAIAGTSSTPGQVREAVPLAGNSVVGGVHFHTGGQANPQRTLQAYAWAAQDHGARILQHTAAPGIEMRAGKASCVRTAAGVIDCAHLVVAAGPQSGILLRDIGIELPLAPARAEMIVTETLPLMPIKACFYTVTADQRFIVRPEASRGWLFSACSGHGFKLGPLMADSLAAAIAGERDRASLAGWAAGALR